MTNDHPPAVRHLHTIGWVEGISYLLLVFIAMPLKYLAGMPMAVRVVGSIHGLLFVWFCVALLVAWRSSKWNIVTAGLIFLSSLIPFGPFVMDRLIAKPVAPQA